MASRRYERRRPEKTPLHRVVCENLESWLQRREAAERPVPGYVEDELRGYLECGLLCFGFARARCTGCGQGFVVAFSCKGRGVCPSCNGRHMAQTAAHLVDHVIPPVPVRQWVISVPKRLRGMLADRPRAVAALTKIFLDEIEKILTHLGEPLEPPPVSPARGPPTDWGELVQAHDDRGVFQASPDELPVIDIHSLCSVPDAR